MCFNNLLKCNYFKVHYTSQNIGFPMFKLINNMKNIFLNLACLSILSCFFLLNPSNLLAQCSNDCNGGVLDWNTYEFSGDNPTESYTVPHGGGSVGVVLEIIDPFNRNADADLYTTHPFDPAGGCQALGDGPANCGGNDDEVPGDGSVYDPWDSDCKTYITQTNGIYGSGYLSPWQKTATSDEEVEFKYTFSDPVLICGFRISDIDAVGWVTDDCVANNVGNSYQDEIRVAAESPCGDVVVDIQQADPGGPLIIDPTAQTVYATYDPTANLGVSPDDAAGEAIFSTNVAVTSFSFFYSNGPDDAAYEQANPQDYTLWSDVNGVTNGASDGHAVRVDALPFCACPDYQIAVVAPECIEDGATFTVSSNTTATQLWVGGVQQTSTTEFTVSQPFAASYEIVIVGTDGCKDVISYDVGDIETCSNCPPKICISQFGEFTITKTRP